MFVRSSRSVVIARLVLPNPSLHKPKKSKPRHVGGGHELRLPPIVELRLHQEQGWCSLAPWWEATLNPSSWTSCASGKLQEPPLKSFVLLLDQQLQCQGGRLRARCLWECCTQCFTVVHEVETVRFRDQNPELGGTTRLTCDNISQVRAVVLPCRRSGKWSRR
jgi:hypothetical protein